MVIEKEDIVQCPWCGHYFTQVEIDLCVVQILKPCEKCERPSCIMCRDKDQFNKHKGCTK